MAFDRKQYQRKYYLEHRDAEIKRARKWRKEHREDVLKQKQEYYQEHQEDLTEKARKRRRENPERMREIEKKRSAKPKRMLDQKAAGAKRRVKKLGNKPPKSWGPRNQEKIKEIFALAAWLTKNRKQKYVVDHIKPVVRGGAHHQRNLRVVTESVNGRKGSKLDSECNFDIDYWVWETVG